MNLAVAVRVPRSRPDARVIPRTGLRTPRGRLIPHRKLGGSLATAVVAAELAIMFIRATLPTPLYPIDRRTLSFSGMTLTLIDAVYVIGNLVAPSI